MPKSRPQYPAEFRQQILELPQTIMNLLAQSARDTGKPLLFAILECELIDRRRFKTKTEPRLAVFSWIEGWSPPPPPFAAGIPIAGELRAATRRQEGCLDYDNQVRSMRLSFKL